MRRIAISATAKLKRKKFVDVLMLFVLAFANYHISIPYKSGRSYIESITKYYKISSFLILLPWLKVYRNHLAITRQTIEFPKVPVIPITSKKTFQKKISL